MAFPTTSILDDFNRADQADLVDGVLWGDKAVQDHLRLESHQVRENGSGNFGAAYWLPSTFGPDCEVYYTVNVLPGGSAYVRLYARLTNTATASETGYMMQWSNNTSGARIFKETAKETFTQLAQNAAARFVAGDQLGLELIGSSITLYNNGTSVLNVSDSTYTTAGHVAIGGLSTVFRLDDFGGGTLAAASTFVPRTILI